DEIITLPAMTDPVCKAVLEVLTAVQAAARFTDQNLPRLIAARMANISLEHGHTDGSCMAYMWFGQLLIARFNDYQSGLRFGKLGLDLAERRGLDRFGARLYHVFGHSISPWVNSTEVSLGWLRRAFDAAQKAGDLTYAAYARNFVSHHPLRPGRWVGRGAARGGSCLGFRRAGSIQVRRIRARRHIARRSNAPRAFPRVWRVQRS